MMRPAAFLGYLIPACLSAGLQAEEMKCGDAGSTAVGSVLEDVRDGCEAARSAAGFFATSGLSMPGDVRISILDGPSSSQLGEHETGHYDARERAIRVLAYLPSVKATENNEAGLGRIVTRAHWRSYVVHELAHAAIHAECSSTCPSRAMHEYVAAVAQIASLPGRLRAELLKPYRHLEPFQKVSEITEIYYAINPHYFAVKAYKHYQQQPDPRAFFRSVLHLSD